MKHVSLQPSDIAEIERVLALYDADVLGPPPAELQSLVVLAGELLGGPAFLTFIDKDTLHAGIGSAGPFASMPRCETICNSVIRQKQVFVLEDVAAAREFADCGAVRLGIGFYAGVPVHAPDRQGRPRALGSLCIIGTAPRRFGEAERASLRRLGLLADGLLAARSDARRALDIAARSERLAADLGRRNQVLAQAERLTQIGSWRMSLPDEALAWSAGVWSIYGLTPGTDPTLEIALAPYAEDARARIQDHLARAIETGTPFDFEEDFTTAAGARRRVRCLGEREETRGIATGLVGVFQDITDRCAVEAMLRRDAATDPLTGLANRQGFERMLAEAMERARAGAPLVLAMMDLDGFKAINDTHGHAAGDDVLRAIGEALRSDPPPGTYAARLGGDEFAVIVEHPALCADPGGLIERLDAALRVPIEAERGTTARGTVGWAAFAPDCLSPQAFMRLADASLYQGKRARGGDWRRGAPRLIERRRAHAADS